MRRILKRFTLTNHLASRADSSGVSEIQNGSLTFYFAPSVWSIGGRKREQLDKAHGE